MVSILKPTPGCRHLYADTQPGTTDIVVLSEFPILYGNAFTTAWLGHMLNDATGGRLWFEPRKQKSSDPFRTEFNLAQFGKALPSLREKRKGSWTVLEAGPDLPEDLKSIPTIYGKFHNGFPAFAAKLAEELGPSEGSAQAADSTYKYSMFGANQKSHIASGILRSHGIADRHRGLDVGGGYGFYAAELAAHGAKYDVIDYDRKKAEIVGPWLAARAQVADRVAFRTGTIEQVPGLPRAEPYDVVSFFGSMLYADRSTVPAVLRACMEMLRPGGILMIHENVREGGKPESNDYMKMFPADELRGLLRQNAGEPICYSMFSGEIVPWEQAARSLVMAAIRKN
jgi:SAM-dependent methyltransferase